MPDFNANFQYTANGRITQQGPCSVELDAETFTLTPDSGAPISFDLGDLNGVLLDTARATLLLYTGSSLLVNGLGTAYGRFVHELTEAFRDRTTECLLLPDMKELAKFDATFEIGTRRLCPSCGARARGKFCSDCGAAIPPPPQASSATCVSCGATTSGKFCSRCGTPLQQQTQTTSSCGEAELRLYESNLAVLPAASQGFQWRLADIDAVYHEPNGYDVILDAGDVSMRVTALGKRTRDFADRVRESVRKVATNGARALHQTFPFLNPDQLQSTAGLMREGRAVPLTSLAAIHPRIEQALSDKAVDKDLKPYYEELLRLSAPDFIHVGYKLIRPEQDDVSETDNSAESQQDDLPETDTPAASEETLTDAKDADANDLATLTWFFFPLAKRPGSSELSNLVAWEANSRSGRATYFFRLVNADAGTLVNSNDAAAIVTSSICKLNTALTTLNFRRRPIYLSDDELEGDAQWRRYAIAVRRIPELRDLRALFVGRASHASLESWKTQVENIVAKERS